MIGELLDDSTIELINNKLPDIDPLRNKIFALSPDVISMKFSPDSDIPVASVCLTDAIQTIAGVRYALLEYYANQVYYREKTQPPNEMAAVFFERYYADDAALRLYSAGEHVANAIIFMMEITDADLKPYRKSRVSQQSTVGIYLIKKKPAHPISQSLANLAKSKEWKSTGEYRNKWVHDQPPTIRGLGIVYRRQKRWKKLESGALRLGIGGGDTPEYTTDDILSFVKPAFNCFLTALDTCVQCYLEILADKGVQPNKGTKSRTGILEKLRLAGI